MGAYGAPSSLTVQLNEFFYGGGAFPLLTAARSLRSRLPGRLRSPFLRALAVQSV